MVCKGYCFMKRNNKIKRPKILLFDIETAPNLAYVWGKYQQDVIEFESEWYILCFAYKWLDDKKTHVVSLPDFKNYKDNPEDDSALVKELHTLFDEADIIIAHNGDNFDLRKTNARFLYHGLTPPSPYKSIDTLKMARKYFKFNSNRLDDLGKILNLGEKNHTGGFSLWKGCLNGNKTSWKQMADYNKQDVVLLEKVYKALLPWIHNHPNRGLLEGKRVACPNCSGSNVQRRGFNYTRVGKYQRWQCTDCGAWSQERKTEKTDVVLK